MQPVLGDRRPNCLVIDEIDGALGGGAAAGGGGGAVAAIAEIIRTGRVRVKEGEGAGSGKAGSVPLSRPVICICNDLYTPALRPLREVAEVLEVGPPEDRMLRARLREVCRRERANVQEAVRTLSKAHSHGSALLVSGGHRCRCVIACMPCLLVVHMPCGVCGRMACKTANAQHAFGGRDIHGQRGGHVCGLWLQQAQKHGSFELCL